MSQPIKIVCKECGSRKILRDAWATWDSKNQRWELNHTFDYFFCEDCEGKVSINEVPI